MVEMGAELSAIKERKQEEVKALYDSKEAEALKVQAYALKTPSRAFASPALQCTDTPAVIAQVWDAKSAEEAQRGGASALAVLTDKYFDATQERVREVTQGSDLSILDKDFILDEVQLYQKRIAGVGAVLMMPGFTDEKDLKHLIYVADTLGLECLVEVRTQGELEKMGSYGGRLVGINNRDLSKLPENVVDLATTENLLPHIPKYTNVISLSGVNDYADIQRLGQKKITTIDGNERPLVAAVVVGRALESADDIEAKVRELRGQLIF